MKKIIITTILGLLTIISTSAFIISSTGIAGYTGSPGEASCNNFGCHSGGSSAAAGATIISVPSFTADEFVQGTTYTITIQLAAVGYNRYGFDCEILDANNNNTNAGSMINQGSGVKFLNSGGRKNAVHTAARFGTGGTSFTFNWVAPLLGDTATIYVAGNAVNLNGTTSGDFPIPPIKMHLKAHVEPEPVDTNTVVIPNGIHDPDSYRHQVNNVSSVSVFPNPARGFTSISYDLPQTQQVSLQLISTSGKMIREFLNEKQIAGSHEHLLNLHNIAPGIYFVKISVEGQKVSQKLIAVQ